MPSSVNGVQAVRVADTEGHGLLIRTDGSITTSTAPENAKFYLHGMSDVPGVATANNFLSIFNPVGSGKTVIFYQLILTPGTSGATSVTNSMNIFRTTAASGGTQIAAANVNRFVTADGNPVAEVRVGNPTTTNVGTTLLGLPPGVDPVGVSSGSSASVAIPSGAGFVCLPGEGVVYNTAAGSTNQLWNINVTWAEL